MKTEPSNLLIFSTVAAIAVGLFAFFGCTTAPTAAYRTEATTDAAVSATMGAWGNYVAQYHPPVSEEQQVEAAFNKYQAAELAVIDATTAYVMATSTNSTAANSNETTAMASATAALTDLINLAQQFESNTNK